MSSIKWITWQLASFDLETEHVTYHHITLTPSTHLSLNTHFMNFSDPEVDILQLLPRSIIPGQAAILVAVHGVQHSGPGTFCGLQDGTFFSGQGFWKWRKWKDLLNFVDTSDASKSSWVRYGQVHCFLLLNCPNVKVSWRHSYSNNFVLSIQIDKQPYSNNTRLMQHDRCRRQLFEPVHCAARGSALSKLDRMPCRQALLATVEGC